MAGQESNLSQEARGWAIATNFAFGVAGMVLIGFLLERYVWPKASPWIIVGCAAAGLIGGGYRFLSDALAANRSFSTKKR